MFARVLSIIALAGLASLNAWAGDPLPTWHDSASKQAIITFVDKVTREGSPDYVAPAARIAVFDNDGTLWSEHPLYVQMAFALDRVKALAPRHPEWKEQQPFKAVLEGDMKTLAAGGEKSLLEVVLATHAGVTVDEFEKIVLDWLSTARHPKYQRPYTELIYHPMRELLDYLRANGFKTYIVSGGGIEFMRPWVEEVYGIPPKQHIGSVIKTQFELRDGKPVLVQVPQIDFVNDRGGKPVGINRQIGRRPIAAFGNSDGDMQMLQWTTAGAGPRFGLLVHHTDGEREAAYDRNSPVGKLDKALDAAKASGWSVVDMKSDWKLVFLPR